MPKYSNDETIDAMLDEIAEGNILTVCSAAPTTRTEAITTYKLADVALTPGDGNGDFAISNGDSSGRKLVVSSQSAVPIDSSGTATHVAICDGTRLLYYTTCTSLALVAAQTVDLPSWKIEVGDPT